jgi:hypothetical protein
LSSRWRQCNSAAVLIKHHKLERMARTTALKATWWANYNVRLMLNNILADAFELVELGEVSRRKEKQEKVARRKFG